MKDYGVEYEFDIFPFSHIDHMGRRERRFYKVYEKFTILKRIFLRRSREVELLDNKLVEGFLDRLSFIHFFMM